MRGPLTDEVRIRHVLDAITEVLRISHLDIEWKSIIGFRNISIHEYFGVNFQIIWEIAQNDLPVLQKQFSDLLG